ncbi:response regulator [Bradyrhizobium sp. HKCCYLS2038]|uniref:response regulator n=1 Tax=unclassified Bradyrhizobium TaxID=2631580 RepID=UPI003EB9C757
MYSDPTAGRIVVSSATPHSIVVEDDSMIRMYACEILADAGFHCHEAADSDQAKARLDKDGASITLLFTDVDMPGSMDGFELARYAAQNWPEIAIVVASGRVKPEPGQLPDGATFIPKPFSADLVHDHLQQMLPDGKKPEPLRRGTPA